MTWSLLPLQYPAANEMDRLIAEAERWFQAAPAARAGRTAYPRVNAWANPDGMMLSAELPGLDPAKIEVTIHENRVTLAGETAARETPAGVTWHRGERHTGRFSRDLTLPYRVAADKVKAEYRHGLLVVSLPRVEEDKPHKITVTNA